MAAVFTGSRNYPRQSVDVPEMTSSTAMTDQIVDEFAESEPRCGVCLCKRCHPLTAVIAVCVCRTLILVGLLLNAIFNTELERFSGKYAVIIVLSALLIFGAATIVVLCGFWKLRPNYALVHILVQLLWIGGLVAGVVFLASKELPKQELQAENLALLIVCCVMAILEIFWVRVVWICGVKFLNFKLDRLKLRRGSLLD